MSSVCSAVQTIKSGNGSQTQFSFDFPYVFKSEIHVYFWNVTTKEYDEVLTTDATYPWEIPTANPTVVNFTSTAPPSPSDATANIKIRRITNIDDIQALFNPGSAIRSDDLNSNFEQLRFAIQESLCPDITEAEVTTYLQNYYWNNFDETITSTDTWSSSDTKIATTAAIQGQLTNIDISQIKSDDIIETSAYSSTWDNEDDKIATAGALAARHDVVVNTDLNPPSTAQVGKQWLSTAAGNQVHKIYDGSGWRTVAVGQPFSPATTTIVRYVDSTNGSDASDVTGFLPQAPLQTIGRALELINASSSGDGSLIKVAPGVYQETLPLRIKKNNISIVGESMRSCFVHPTVATENNDMFEVDSGSYIANLTLLGLKVPTADQGTRNNSLDNDSTYGLPSNQPFSVRFRTDVAPTILKSPYIQNCTHFSDAHFDNANFDPNTFPSTDAQTYSAVAGDETSAPCGGGLLIDGSAVSSSSPVRSMVVDAFTQICLDGPGVLVTNNGYAQLVSFFGTFTHYHAKAKNGGTINLSNCVSDFGRYGLIADGKSPSPIATSSITSPSVGAGNGATTVTIGSITTAASYHGDVNLPSDYMMITIDGVDYGITGSTVNGSGFDVTLSSPLTSNITSASVDLALRSYISTGGHTFEFVGVGTDYGDHPDNGGVPVEANQVIELNGGKVWQSSTDHVGKFKAGSVLVVDQVAETVDLKDTTVTGNITVTGTVDGRDVATDGTKLDGIEANADVTDATNVDAAGAVMNSDTSTTAMQFVVDEDNMSSNSSTKVPTQQSVKAYVDAEVANVVDSAPGTLDTLNELAAALGDDANFSTTVTNSIATKLPLAGGTMTGNIVMSGSQTVDGRDLSVDGAKLDGIATGATAYSDTDVDTHLNTSTASANEVLSWTGTDYDWVAQSGGGGGDATTLDSLDSTQFLRSDAADVKTSGNLTFNDSVRVEFGTDSDAYLYHNGYSLVFDNLVGSFYIRNLSDDRSIHLRTDNGTGSIIDYVVCNGTTGEVELTHYGAEKLATKSTGIDVTGNITVSGTVDGRDVAADGALAASAVQPGDNVSALTNDAGYLTAGTIDAATLDSLDSTQFLRSDTADTKTSGDLNFSDNISATFGNGSDLDIYHNGANSYIDNDLGSLNIRQFAADRNVTIKADNGSGAPVSYFEADGASGEAQLFHYGSQKLNTIPDGIEVSGLYLSPGLGASSLNSYTVDLSLSGFWITSINANTTLTFTNPPASNKYGGFALLMNYSSGVVTWPTTVKWPDDTAPTLTASKKHMFVFTTTDGGSVWRGAYQLNYAS